jgi:hypothetical protein
VPCSGRGKAFPREATSCASPPSLGDGSPSPSFPTPPGGSRLRSHFVPSELQPLNRNSPPRTHAVPKLTNPSLLRVLDFVRSRTVLLSRRTGLDGLVCSQGHRPSRRPRAPKFRPCLPTWDPAIDSAHPGFAIGQGFIRECSLV